MNTCATCLHLAIGRRFVRCGSKAAPRAALPHLEACDKYTEARDALNAEWVAPAPETTGPWSKPERAHEETGEGAPLNA